VLRNAQSTAGLGKESFEVINLLPFARESKAAALVFVALLISSKHTLRTSQHTTYYELSDGR
jgi:hypothetical protein